jgi:hypothetical protein
MVRGSDPGLADRPAQNPAQKALITLLMYQNRPLAEVREGGKGEF